jgi:hypothetical protein
MINQYSNPFLSFDNDGDYYYVSPREYARLQQQQAYEKEMLRRQLAYRRQLALKEEEDRRRAAYERELARQMQEKLAAEEANKRREQARQSAGQQYQIVRGPGGYLYRVPVEVEEEVEYLRGPDGRLYKVVLPKSSAASATVQPAVAASKTARTIPIVKEAETANSATMKEQQSPTVVAPANQSETPKKQRVEISNERNEIEVKVNKKSKRKKITVVVEDASDSEYEDDDLKSVWRHRVPSPSESWMEPVVHMS